MSVALSIAPTLSPTLAPTLSPTLSPTTSGRLAALDVETSGVARAVVRGFDQPQKTLPPWLFYDREGSRLFERITELPEYYPTRVERSIFVRHGEAIVRDARGDQALTMVELGAGTASKTRVLLAALSASQGRCEYVPIDVSRSALEEAARSIERELPNVRVRPQVGTSETSGAHIEAVRGRKLVLFIGSSIGNYDVEAAVTLLSGVRAALSPGDGLLLGTDLRKDRATLLAAYDDAAGVTAEFNRNVLVRLRRELGADFDLAHFRHVARWNEATSSIEMHLESTIDQTVRVAALDRSWRFRRGETIHTESSMKYDIASVRTLLRRAGFALEKTYEDERRWFGVHLAKV
jgi:dimethylhistidine N-methyltransferase